MFHDNVNGSQFAALYYRFKRTHADELIADTEHDMTVNESAQPVWVDGSKLSEQPDNTERGHYKRTDFADGCVEVQDVIAYKDNMKGNKEAVMEFLGFNVEEWECVSMRESIWEGGKAGANKYSFQIKVWPRKAVEIAPEKLAEKAKAVFAKVIEPKGEWGSKDYFALNKVNRMKGSSLNARKLFLIPQIEAHLGKIASKYECNNVYNHDIVEKRVRKVFQEVVDKQRVEKCDTALIVIGGDFFNSESNNATTAGTPQTATDTRYVEMFGIGLNLYAEGIELLRNFFNKVEVILCSGNHARALEFCMYAALESRYINDPRVHFKHDYHETQEYVFGTCGLFFNHGDVNQKRLVASIPCEFPEQWGKTRSRYLFCGHLHKLEVSNNENGLIFHRTPAICENDAWHYSNRFGIGVVPQHEVMVFDRDCGMVADYNIYFNETRDK